MCPACGLREINDEETGFCIECADEQEVERYLEEDNETIETRRSEWRLRTAAPHATRERQRRHRLLERTRPIEPATEWDDPLELANDALHRLERVRKALGAKVAAVEQLDEACELLRKVAWGPERDNGNTIGK